MKFRVHCFLLQKRKAILNTLLIMKFTAIFLLAACLQVTATGYSQNVTLSVKNASLQKVFKEINKQTGFQFFYKDNLLNQVGKVDIDVKNMPLEEVLNNCFKMLPVTYQIIEKTIVVKEKELKVEEAKVNEPLFIDIKGVVTDAEGKGIPSVSVTIKGTQRGTSTDNNGNFSIVAEKGEVLVFSSVSYGTKEIKVSDGSIDVHLELETKPLESVLIGGNLAAIKRKADISSVTTITSKQLERSPYQSVDQALTGLVPGVAVIRSTEGAAYSQRGSVQIRGASGGNILGTISAGRVGVYVDGVEMPGGSGFLSTLDKNVVDRIEVVRGPSAATLYGSGSNGGVILIYTKKGQRNVTAVDASVSAGWYDSKWQDSKPFRHLETFNVKQGFAKDFVYNLGGSYESAETYQPGGKNNTANIFGSLTYSRGKLDMTLTGRYNNINSSPSRNAQYDTSSSPIFNRSGFRFLDTVQYGVQSTPSVAFNLSYKATGWWKHNLVLGYSVANYYQRFRTKYATTASQRVMEDDKYTEPTIRYFNTIELGNKDKFSVNLLTGVEYKKQIEKRVFFLMPSTLIKYPDDIQERTGAFGQLQLALRDKYFLTLGGREDWDKNLGSGREFSPRVGFTTNFSVASFTIKPRVSWGKGTTPPLPAYRHYTGLNPQNGLARLDNPDIKSQTQAGWDLGLETYSNDGKLRFEVIYFNNLITDAFQNKFTTTPDPQFPGITNFTQVINIGKVANKGWEFSVDYTWNILHAMVNYSITDSRLKEAQTVLNPATDYPLVGEQMYNTPKTILGLDLGATFPNLFGKKDKLALSVNMSRQDKTTGSNEFKSLSDQANGIYTNTQRSLATVFPGANIWNFNIAYSITPLVEISAQCRNLTNNTDPMHFGRVNVGRGWLFSLKYHFSNNTK